MTDERKFSRLWEDIHADSGEFTAWRALALLGDLDERLRKVEAILYGTDLKDVLTALQEAAAIGRSLRDSEE